ncbi:serine/threonine-protein kinase-like protein [Amniculicola lignicola CBS 123094]|uniref:Serine/threonine-protein kinase-like protein n=1 Tax=Amniculicola lignicola CBS 123094 TaxID=1392246 RepID=A0A6A5VVQ4_9PLEO|nr:serine/threonine-protein kinase-like protein [Amniculicola lignicola CBS 123094]
MLLSLRKWMRSLWRGLKSAGSPVQKSHTASDTSLTLASPQFDFVTPLIHYYALPRGGKAALRIESARDLSPLYEAFSEEDDEHGNPIFLYSSFGFISDDFTAYFGKSKLRKYDLTSKDIKESLKLLPDEDVYPEAPWDITTSAIPIDSNVFLKGPKLHTAFIGTGLLPKLILQEVKTMELLLHSPHPNIIRYHGCLIKRGRIVGIVLDRHPMTLKQRLEDGMRHINVETCMSKITSAVSHLHTLGLAHNDLTPMNIMVNEYDTPFIIDFGSCQPFGCELITAGTPGWIDEDFAHSTQDHDESAIGKLRTWLEKQGRDSIRE